MASGRLPKPGAALGPCDADAACGHRDCEATRADAHSLCQVCFKAIGYEIAFYKIDRAENVKSDRGLVHAACYEAP